MFNSPVYLILLLLKMLSVYHAKPSDILFPDTFETMSKMEEVKKCANGLTFCESFEFYPHDRVKKILESSQTNKTYTDYFGEDRQPIIINNRLNEKTQTFFCNPVERTIFPQVGENINQKWKLIVNQKEEGYVQGVRIEVCQENQIACNIIGNLPKGYKTSCEQKYIYRKMLSVSDNGTIGPDSFKLPSTCCCAYKMEL